MDSNNGIPKDLFGDSDYEEWTTVIRLSNKEAEELADEIEGVISPEKWKEWLHEIGCGESEVKEFSSILTSDEIEDNRLIKFLKALQQQHLTIPVLSKLLEQDLHSKLTPFTDFRKWNWNSSRRSVGNTN